MRPITPLLLLPALFSLSLTSSSSPLPPPLTSPSPLVAFSPDAERSLVGRRSNRPHCRASTAPRMAVSAGELLTLWMAAAAALCLAPRGSEGRAHYHKTRHRGAAQGDGRDGSGGSSNSISYPPAGAPAGQTVPSDPYEPPSPERGVFDVREFGAVGDGDADDTEAFRAAWKAACQADSAAGSTLLVPPDSVFSVRSTIFSGPCKQGFVFQVDGVLMPPDGPDCWPESDSRRQWLVFYRVDGMELKGSGTIEGNGEKWWDLPCKPHRGPNGSTLPGPCDSPAMIRFFLCSNVTVRDLCVENSPQFHVKFDACEGVHIEGLMISSPATSPNTDGIHIENTKFVAIYNSMISNGDDCISIGPGCSNVAIENVTCGHSHGISIGSLGVHNSQACVSNVTVRNSVIRDSDNGLRIKTWQGGTGSVSGITFDSVYMENVRNCIIIDQYYCFTKACRNQTSAVYVTDVSYTNVKGTYNVRSAPVHFACSDTVPCTNITMSEVELLPFEGELVDDPFCWNAYGAMQTATIPPIECLQEGMPQALQESLTLGC